MTDFPLAIRYVSGRIVDVLYNYHDQAGNVAGVFAAARDVTQRTLAEVELAKHQQHLRP